MNLHNTRTQNRLLGGIIGIGIAGIFTSLAYEILTPASFPSEPMVATNPGIQWQPIAAVIVLAWVISVVAGRVSLGQTADENSPPPLYIPEESRTPLNRENEYTAIAYENDDGYGCAIRDWDTGIQLVSFDEHDELYEAVWIAPEEAAAVASMLADWEVGEPVEVRDD